MTSKKSNKALQSNYKGWDTTSAVVKSLRDTGKTYSAEWTVNQVFDAKGVSSLEALFAIMSLARPYGSDSCKNFVSDLAVYIQRNLGANVVVDCVDNIIVQIGSQPDTLWSCHTDTVHPNAQGYGELAYDAVNVCSKNPRQLGADDGVGVWIMLSMIEAGVKGLYIFHAGEEVGGIGSNHIATNNSELLKGIDFAIAFDRKGTNSIITHQSMGRCCSNLFAKSLGDALGMGHTADNTGLFTDTANYVYDIPECTNLSAGYYDEHKYYEHLNYVYARSLRDAVIAASKSGGLNTLKVGKNVEQPYMAYDYTRGNYGSGYGYDDDLGYDYYAKGKNAKKSKVKNSSLEYDCLCDLIERDPATAASILTDMGVDCDYFEKYWVV